MDPSRPSSRTDLVALAAILLLAAGLRFAAATGAGLSLDEAWSLVHAVEAGGPAGVFLAINHDNNHHLNSLWLQAVGAGAPLWAQRGLAIATGTAAVAAAWAIGRRRGRFAALAAATLFAVSPLLVTYGSEARGYAPMVLALLGAILLVDRWLAGGGAAPRWRIGACFLVAALANLTALFALAAIGPWIAATLGRRGGWRAAVVRTIDVLIPAAGAVLLMFVVTFGAPLLGGPPMRVGGLEAFRAGAFVGALGELHATLLTTPHLETWAPLAGAAAALGAAFRLRLPRRVFHLAAIVGLPVGLAVLQPANAASVRYLMVGGIAGLLLLSDLLDALWRWRRGAAVAALGACVVVALAADRGLIEDARGHPDGAVLAMRRFAPGGGTLLVERPGAVAIHGAAAVRLGYPARIAVGCGPADALVVDRYAVAVFAARLEFCGMRWRLVATAHADRFTHDSWALYRRDGDR